MVVLTVLSNKEEELIHNELKKNALSQCSRLVQELVACTKVRTITVYWACKDQTAALNKCLAPYTTENERDKLREKHIALKNEWIAAGKPLQEKPGRGAGK
ncbi:uncharacterized protein EV422DRAFT_534855 [Fimicolochytrium jonesii]|uniref:uncharacterized protein n=1 Tax=Fimicolochytrium jonesii TaxID=1396493 RepID=UPI0022FE53A7|nr:uncharacterized protein EV422DRAFT_534855 [Fimicolochytrium jonesii]KAI8819463.1 hypothetical protein EV422DRAFT_534855 [Fimicolochytrium jonesii]